MPVSTRIRTPLRIAAGLLVAGTVLALLIGGFLPRWWLRYYEGLWAAYDPRLPYGGLGLRLPAVLGSLRFSSLLLLALGAAGGYGILRGLFGRSPRALLWTHVAFGCTELALVTTWFAYGSFLDAELGGNLVGDIAAYNTAANADFPLPMGLRGMDYFQSWDTGLAILVGLALVVAHVCCSTGVAYRHHRVDLPGPAPGDRIREFFRIGGEDPPWARSVYASFLGHLLIIFLPLLLSLLHSCGRKRWDYPGGSGRPAAPPVTAPQIVKKKRFVLAENSIYIFRDPTPNDSKVIKKIDQQSQNIYAATNSGTPGALGEGDGDEGGFGGPANGILTFVRLKYNCHKFHDGNSRQTGNADKNFLRWYKENPAVKFKVAPMSEEISILALKQYEPGFAPPFVYMTGEGKGSVSSAEVEVLKQYIKDGGLLLVDAGSNPFHNWFVGWVRCLTNNQGLVEISDDDEIFRIAYGLSNIEPLFSHSGRKNARAMGYKYQGRWAIFYHPGDMNDAWKDSASSVSKRLRDNARAVAYNVIYYAMIKYHEVNREHYKK